MGCELDGLLCEAWARVREKVLGDERELHRRLERRQKIYDDVPRPLCFAIRAGDRRINEMNAWLSVRDAAEKGNEVEHQVQITSQLVKDLCRPVEPYWGQEFRNLARELGCDKNLPRKLERRGVLPGRRIQGLGGQRGKPVPLVDGFVPAMASEEERKRYGRLLLDPGARAHTAPPQLLLPYWEEMASRLPHDIEQILTRKPKRRIRGDSTRLMGWVWSCPGCGRNAQTLYLPAGSPDWAAAHQIALPKVAWFEPPSQPTCFACHRCHHLFGISQTPRTMTVTWSKLIAHMSGGLLYGREVKRPASFGIVRKHRRHVMRNRKAAPRRDELERYLVHTELTTQEIARRMERTHGTVQAETYVLCRMRGVKRREGLRQWWAKNRPGDGRNVVAA